MLFSIFAITKESIYVKIEGFFHSLCVLLAAWKLFFTVALFKFGTKGINLFYNTIIENNPQ